MRTVVGSMLVLAAAFGAAAPRQAHALINPNFTPVHLVNQASLILELRAGPAKDGKITATVTRVLKGESDRKPLSLVLTTSAFPQHVKTVETTIVSPEGTTGLFFAGDVGEQASGPGMSEEGAEPAEQGAQRAFLHIQGTWIAFVRGRSGDWEMDQVSGTMGTTWNGGTDMLTLAADYILSDPEADMPVREGVLWAGKEALGKLDGPARLTMAVDLAGDGKQTLYIACESGDRLFRYDAKALEMKDVTPAARLAAKSRAAAWGDFNADGWLDLLSWDGEALSLCVQTTNGTFNAGRQFLKNSFSNGCLSLTSMDGGKAGRTVALIGTRTAPLLWSPDEPDRVKPVGGAFAGAALGGPGPCLAADLDADSYPDILQLFEKGSLVFKGSAPGEFQDAKPCGVSLGQGAAGAFLGDYDADGLFDIFTVASQGATRLWNNRGKFEFADTFAMAGELSYKGDRGVLGGMTGDFNNDGRQDVLFWYDMNAPRLYFNRGFRSFGLANGMDLEAHEILPQANEGEQAGCLADLNGDGAQDMILVLRNGEVWAFYVEAGGGSSLCLRGALSSRGSCVGPLTVTGWSKDRCLGAWNVVAGTAEAFVGLPQAGPATLKWQAPGGKPQHKDVVVENVPVRVVLAP